MTYRVLAYHTIGDYPAELPSGISTPPADFARQLDWLARAGFSIVPLETVVANLAAPRPREVAITFDDGWADSARRGWPLLAERGLPATFFVSSDLLGLKVPMGGVELLMMDADELAELARQPGVTIGSHAATHVSLRGAGEPELERELAGSRARLTGLTGRPVRWLSNPFGAYDARVQAAARRAGYDEAFSVWTRDEGPFARLRIPVHTRDGLLRFRAKLSAFYFPLKRWLKR